MTQLTNCQKKAVDAFFNFMLSDEKIFVISGPAGVGKTFLMSHLAQIGMEEYRTACKVMDVPEEINKIAFTATTNKAAEVLEQGLGQPVGTVHSFLNLVVKENYKTGKSTVERTRNWKQRHNLLLFVDECSMIDYEVFRNIMETLSKTSKVVFVGDHNQMSPVDGSTSPVYTQVDTKNFVTLNQAVRNAGQPALMNLCAQLRETVETGTFFRMEEVPGVIDYLSDAEMEQELQASFTTPGTSARVLAYTNNRVDAYISYIRSDTQGKPDQFVPGDRAVVVTAYRKGDFSLPVERELTISAVHPVKETCDYGDAITDPGDKYHGIAFPYYEVEINRVLLQVPYDKEFYNRVLKAYAKKKMWREMYEFRDSFLNLRDRSASTVYKAQGSTYDTVFVDLGNIGTAFSDDQIARMLYVAVSRATTRVCFYGELPARLKGKSTWIPGNANSPISSISSSPTLPTPTSVSSMGVSTS